MIVKIKILWISILLILTGSCVSITQVNSVSNSTPINSDSNEENKIEVFLVGNKKCLTKGQRDSIKQSILKNLQLTKFNKVNVYISEKNHQPEVLTLANFIIFAGTLTIIPLYTSADYYIDVVGFDDSKTVKHYKGMNNEETLVSILMLPAVPFNQMTSGRRINMDRTIYEAVGRQALEVNLEDEPILQSTNICGSIEGFFQSQLW